MRSSRDDPDETWKRSEVTSERKNFYTQYQIAHRSYHDRLVKLNERYHRLRTTWIESRPHSVEAEAESENLVNKCMVLVKESTQLSRDWAESMVKSQPEGTKLRNVLKDSSKAKLLAVELKLCDLIRSELETGLPNKGGVLDKFERTLADLEALVTGGTAH